MRKLLTFWVGVFILGSVSAQSKSEILEEINNYKKKVTLSNSYNHSKKDIVEALNIIASEKYTRIEANPEDNVIIAYTESELKKEWLTMKILGENAPYRVTFMIKQEKRDIDIENTLDSKDVKYSEWRQPYNVNYEKNYTLLRIRLYEILNGPIQLPNDLMKKIENYNRQQSKEKKKIYEGIDY